MATLKKTIQINPELFKVSQKTKKNRPSTAGGIQPVIKPNSLKRHLINRIKEHKLGEKKTQTNHEMNMSGSESNDGGFTNELYDSFHYLSSLSKKHKEVNNIKERNRERENERGKEKERGGHFTGNKTIKHYSDIKEPFVNIELPEELREPFTPVLMEQYAPPIRINEIVNTSRDRNTNTNTNTDIPYGCLKGGMKPTYRTWNATRKNHESMHEQYISPVVQQKSYISPNISQPSYHERNERERKLELLKLRMKREDEEKRLHRENDQICEELMERERIKERVNERVKERVDTSILNTDIDISSDLKEQLQENQPLPERKRIRRTIHKKYTLGKSKLLNTVGVLLKDNTTRKNIINAQKELKRVAINDVKDYLKTHGLIKCGSLAPNDVLRKTYESAMLAGDIINKNKETLLHNFLHDTVN